MSCNLLTKTLPVFLLTYSFYCLWDINFIITPLVFSLTLFIFSSHYFSRYGLSLLYTFVMVILFFSLLSKSILLSTFNSWALNQYTFVELGYISGNFLLSISFNLDFLSTHFSLLTALVGTFIFCYSFIYMQGEPRYHIFINLILIFIISMLILLTGDNLTTILLGWESIGASSYLLINYWFFRAGTFKSAFKAFSFNKFGDANFILLILLFWYIFGNVNISSLTYLERFTSLNYFILIFGLPVTLSACLFLPLILCSFGKSAQLGLHVWLPDSMEAPVPASALIHSATLISSGIYLILRFYPIFSSDYTNGMNFLMFWGALTAFYGGLVASSQSDLKKILAYSTISHCGLMISSISLGSTYITVFYLFWHGLFKSLSFMIAGLILLNSGPYQDYRKIGKASNIFLLTWILKYMFFCSMLGLAGTPFLLGFFNKHFLVGHFYSSTIHLISVQNLSIVLIYLASFTSIFYSGRTLYNCFFVSQKQHGLSLTIDNISLFKSFLDKKTPFFLFSLFLCFMLLLFTFFWCTWPSYSFYFAQTLLFEGRSVASQIFLYFVYSILFVYMIFSQNSRYLTSKNGEVLSIFFLFIFFKVILSYIQLF